jgi:hypothetical protein
MSHREEHATQNTAFERLQQPDPRWHLRIIDIYGLSQSRDENLKLCAVYFADNKSSLLRDSWGHESWAHPPKHTPTDLTQVKSDPCIVQKTVPPTCIDASQA